MSDQIVMHTAGPWEMREDGEGSFAIAHSGGWVFESDSIAQDRADYVLAAAAPVMLAALRRAVLALAFAAESSPAMRDDYNAVSAAIARATGVRP